MPVYEAVTSGTATVVVTKLATSISTVWTAPTRSGAFVTKKDTVTFRATLTSGVTKLSGKTLNLYDRPTFIRSVVTDVNGVAEFVHEVPTTVGDRTFDINFAGDATYISSATTDVITIEARFPVLTIVAPTPVAAGSSMDITGELRDPKVTGYKLTTRTIRLDYSVNEVTWTEVGTGTTGGTGLYSISQIAPLAAGTYYYRTRFLGGSPGATFEIITSKTTAVEVKEVLSPWDELLSKWNALQTWQKGLIIVAPIGAIVLVARKKK